MPTMAESSLPIHAQGSSASASASSEPYVPEQSHEETDAAVEALTESLNNLEVAPIPSTAASDTSDSTSSESAPSTTASAAIAATTSTEEPAAQKPSEAPVGEPEEELSPEEAKLRALGLKGTHRPGFYIHIDKPKRLRIQTKSKTFDLDRYCPHARADMLKWGVLRDDNTLRCGVHYWGFDLAKNGQCIAHPDETLNACPVEAGLDW